MRKLLLLCLLLVLACPLHAQQNNLDNDTFNGTNTNSLTTYNANWIAWGQTSFNPAQILGSPGFGGPANSTGAAYKTGFTWTNDQYAQLTVDATNLATNIFYVCVRTQTGGPANGICAGIDIGDFNTYYDIAKISNGVASRLGTCGAGSTLCDCFSLSCSTNAQMLVGDIVNFQVQGSTYTLQVKRGAGSFVTLMTGTDSTWATGNPGLVVNNLTAIRLGGSWAAGSVGTPASGPAAGSQAQTGMGK